MVRAQNRRVPGIFNTELSSRRKATKPGQIVEVVHDDGDEEVDHDEGAEEDEGDEVDVGHVGAAGLLRVDQLSGCRIPEEVDNVTWFSFQTTSETMGQVPFYAVTRSSEDKFDCELEG